MSAYNFWDKEIKEPKLKSSLSNDWIFHSPIATPRSSSPPSRAGETIFNNYIDIIHSNSNISTEAKQTEPQERPFDFVDDEDFAFGINLLNNNVACVGDNITKLIQMAQEPWPDNVKLFQPYEVEQILLPDNASCLAVQAFLKMCNLPFEVEMRWNAEFMSPSGRVPFIKCGAFVVSELEPIVQLAANKGITLCGRLSTEEKAEMRAYMSLITNVLVNAELYISWLDNDTYNAVTKIRNSSVYPWPLGWLQTRSKRNMVAKRLKALHWHDKTLEQVLADVEQCCNSLSQRLGDKDYFFGSTPTPLDALVYGHMRALLSASGPKAPLMIKPITSALLRLVLRAANFTTMKLTPQEEYLITQAFQVSSHRKYSPERTISERSTRVRKSRLCVKNTSKDKLGYASRDVFGFKPFASKQIIVMTSNEGAITCEYDDTYKNQQIVLNQHTWAFIVEIIEIVLDKVDEIIYEAFTEKYIEIDTEKSFEVIVYSDVDEEKYGNVEIKTNEYLDTIEENDITDTSVSLETNADDVLVINQDIVMDSDGLVTDKHLAEETDSDGIIKLDINSEATDSSYNKNISEPFITRSCSGNGLSTFNGYENFDHGQSPALSGSKSTLKMPSNEEISVESLLNYLRKQNAAYSYPEVVDLD